MMYILLNVKNFAKTFHWRDIKVKCVKITINSTLKQKIQVILYTFKDSSVWFLKVINLNTH